ncbi:MAG: lactate utilization protein [Eubacterium sp.]
MTASAKKAAYKKMSKGLIENLGKRNIEAFYCDNCIEVLDKVKELVPEGSSIGWGGTETFKETGVLDMLKKGNYILNDRSCAKTPEEVREIYLKHFDSDFFFMSSNAITLDGELVNIDGNANRVACLCYGPKKVIMIVGMNKVVKTVEDGIDRIRVNSCPPNAARLNLKTPCGVTGNCAECLSDQCMCCQIVVTRMTRNKDRIKVILIGEELGF